MSVRAEVSANIVYFVSGCILCTKYEDCNNKHTTTNSSKRLSFFKLFSVDSQYKKNIYSYCHFSQN